MRDDLKRKLTCACFKVNIMFSAEYSPGGVDLIATAITDEPTISPSSVFSVRDKFCGNESRAPILSYRRNTTATVPIHQIKHA